MDSGGIADIFNDYFVDIGRNIAESIGAKNVNHLDCMTHLNQPNSFFFRPIHCYSTEKLICSLKNKSNNLSTIPVKILKSICDIISPCLTNIINRSHTTGVFPDRFKKARATPIPKELTKSVYYWSENIARIAVQLTAQQLKSLNKLTFALLFN